VFLRDVRSVVKIISKTRIAAYILTLMPLTMRSIRELMYVNREYKHKKSGRNRLSSAGASTPPQRRRTGAPSSRAPMTPPARTNSPLTTKRRV
jgi:hypothetical protein